MMTLFAQLLHSAQYATHTHTRRQTLRTAEIGGKVAKKQMTQPSGEDRVYGWLLRKMSK